MGNLNGRKVIFCGFCFSPTTVIGRVHYFEGLPFYTCPTCEKMGKIYLFIKCVICGRVTTKLKRDVVRKRLVTATRGALEELPAFWFERGCQKCNKRG